MKRLNSGALKGILCFMVAIAALAAVPLQAAAQETSSIRDYVIGPGDVLTISVWKDEALTRQVVVLPDGKIGFPLIGQVLAAGRTVAELTKEIEQKLARFVPGVELSVVVHQAGSMTVYVIGKVNSPGRFAIASDVNVLQALAMAGGLNPFAKRGDIKIFREQEGGTKVFFFDYDAVADGKDPKQNMRLKKGDVVVVP
jgi:polysaccharide export outer membrane protein